MTNSEMDLVVQPSTPTRNTGSRVASSRSFPLSTTPPATPPHSRKWTLQQNATIASTPIFCCNCAHSMIDKELFVDFALAASSGISTFDILAQIVIQAFDHMIEFTTSLKSSSLDQSTRYFVFFSNANEYREVDGEFFKHCQVNRQATSLEQACVTCVHHQNTFQLSRFECTVTEKEGVGLKDAELSPQQFSREKRKIMVRKISYGNNDRIEQLAKRLSSARKEDIEAVSRWLSFGRKEQVVEVARRLSDGMERKGEEIDLQLAHVSLYYSESGLC